MKKIILKHGRLMRLQTDAEAITPDMLLIVGMPIRIDLLPFMVILDL
jgi:hypothetical protein